MFTIARRLALATTAALMTPRTHGVLDEDELEQLLADGQAEATDYAYCPFEQHVTAHALHADGSQSCRNGHHHLNRTS